MRLCSVFSGFSPCVGYYLLFVLVSSLVIGTFAAIYHTRIKRVMIFSSVYNAGFFLAAFTVQPTFSAPFSFLFFSSTYLLSMLGLAAVFLGLFDRASGSFVKKVEDLASVRENNTALVAVLILLILSLAGIPPMAVFYGKLMV